MHGGRTGRGIAVALALLAAACSSDRGARTPPARPRNSPPITLNTPPSKETQACFARLSAQRVRYSALPDRDYGGGCTVIGAVQLIDFGVPTTNLKAMACPLAERFTAWVRHGVGPAAREILGSDIARVESFGSFSCRLTVGTRAARLSEHARANAVDVAAFVLADGRRITIQRDWRSADPAIASFLATIHRSACRRFVTVLSPDYNAAHADHLHLDLGGRPLCR